MAQAWQISGIRQVSALGAEGALSTKTCTLSPKTCIQCPALCTLYPAPCDLLVKSRIEDLRATFRDRQGLLQRERFA